MKTFLFCTLAYMLTIMPLTSAWAQTSVPRDYEKIRECGFWEQKVSRNTGSFAWQRTALRVCYDYHRFQKDGKPISERLEAGMGALNHMEEVWNDRSDLFLDYQLAARLEFDLIKKTILELEAAKLKFSDDTPQEMADQLGVLLVLESLEQGY